WFALNHVQLRGDSRQPSVGDADAGALPARQMLVVRARQRMRCQRAIFIWADADEPWVWALESTAGGIAEHRFQPDGLDDLVAPTLAGRAFLFSMPLHRQLWRSAEGHLGTSQEAAALAQPMATRLTLNQGLAVPVLADQGDGMLVLDGIAGLCADDLAFAQGMAEELAIQLNRQALLELTAAAASDRIRLALARDIHDSVLQLLAALGFRLAALQRGIPAGTNQQRQLAELADQLTGSQQELRDYVQNLRDQPGTRAARPELAALTDTLARQWDLACTLDPDMPELELPASLIGEIRQLVREMVANAARHGQARQISVALHRNTGALQLAVRDDGIGFATMADGSIQQPWSLKERVQDLGGTLTVDSGPGGSAIIIALKDRRY
ncbi:MAG: histidine kinase, partial [Sphingomonadales bacterium]